MLAANRSVASRRVPRGTAARSRGDARALQLDARLAAVGRLPPRLLTAAIWPTWDDRASEPLAPGPALAAPHGVLRNRRSDSRESRMSAWSSIV